MQNTPCRGSHPGHLLVTAYEWAPFIATKTRNGAGRLQSARPILRTVVSNPELTPSWITAFLDFAPDRFDDGVAFWSGVTGWGVSESRGESGQAATLLPPAGNSHLRVQRLGSGRGRIHLDLHVPSPRSAADRAVDLGAREVADLGYVVMSSPGGLAFCFVSEPETRPASPAVWPGGHRSLVDQVCLDLPGELHDPEVGFWTEVTGRPYVDSPAPEFSRLVPPAGQPLQLLLQRLDEPLGEVRAHLDLATSDRAAETTRHESLGATVVVERDGWTVLTDLVGSAYCITDREPRA